MTDADSSNLEFEVAVSALLEYGFSKALIKRTLKNILKVYAGNEAWPLIKENGYEVVVERLISDSGPQQRKSQRKAHSGADMEKKQCNLNPESGSAGEVFGSNLGSSSSLLVTPTLDVKNIDIQSHQRNLWAKNGSYPLPAWLKVIHVSKKDLHPKFSDLHVLLEHIDKQCSNQGKCANNSYMDDLEVMAVKDEKFKCIKEMQEDREECRGISHRRSFKPKTGKNVEAAHTKYISNEGLQDSNSTFLNTQKSVDTGHINHAETCLQQSSPAIPQTQKLVDVLHSQHDINRVALDATGIKHFQRKIPLGNNANRRTNVSKDLESAEPDTATQSIPPKTQSTGEGTNNLQRTLYATERLDIARMSACKLTRRRDGGPNPMFSRLQKRKQAGAGASVQNNQQESSDLNTREGGITAMDLDAGEITPRVLVRAEETRGKLSNFQ